MGIDIGGWVEVSRDTTIGKKEWVPALYLDFISERCNDLFEKLFGIYADIGKAIAYNRGAPDGLSKHVLEDMYEEDGEPLMNSITWVCWQEIKDKRDWLVTDDDGKTRRDWRAIFDTMSALAGYYGDDGVRMVVGFI